MKNVRILAVIGFLAFSLSTHAQDYTFRVLANKGANELKSGNTWQPLKTGAQLKIGDELKISDNASVGLVHKNGKPLEVKQAKTYTIAELDQKVSQGGTSVLNKYTDFILSSNSAEAKKNRLSATGAVHRGAPDELKVFLPENQYAEIFNNVAVINWEPIKSGAPYTVSIKNMFDEELSKVETPETSVQIDLGDQKFANETAVLVEVKSKDGKKSEQHLIKKLAPGRLETVKKQLNDEAADLKEETAFNKYLLASVYEEKRLFIDAITCYEQAIKMDPDNPTYKEGYEEFLLRNKLKAEK
jgi:hypothetical protein